MISTNHFPRAAAAFVVVLAMAAGVFVLLTHRLDELRAKAASASVAALRPQESANVTQSESPPPDAPAPMDPAGDLIQRLSDKLLGYLKPEQIDAYFLEAERISLLTIAAKLNSTERQTFQAGFEKFSLEQARAYLDSNLTPSRRATVLAEIKSREKTWIAEQLGPERNASFLAAEAVFDKASAEQQATSAVSRLSRAVDLTLEQKDKLYAGFLDHALNAPSITAERLVLQAYGSISFDPDVPDISAEAEKILTPEQWQTYEDNQIESCLIELRKTRAAQAFVEVFVPAIQELIDEGP